MLKTYLSRGFWNISPNAKNHYVVRKLEMHLSWRFWCDSTSTTNRKNLEMHLL